MIISPELVNQLIPDQEPPGEIVPVYAQSLSETINDPALRRSYLWACTLLNQFTQVQVALVPDRFTQLSAGFIAIDDNVYERSDQKIKREGSFVFGIYILTSDIEVNQTLVTFTVANRIFPVVITSGQIERQTSSPTYVANGSSACWVKSTNPKAKWANGILTCRHTVKHLTVGSSVTLAPNHYYSNPTLGTLADIDACTIDASIIEVAASSWPSSSSSLAVLTPISPLMAIAPGLPSVEFEGRISKGSGTVLRIYRDSYVGNLTGHRIICDCYGKPGDSGTLLRTSTLPMEGAGINIGRIPDGCGGYEGIFQDLYQVNRYFKLDLYL